MHKFRIEMTGPGRGKVFMDGEELQCVKRVSFLAGGDEVTEVTVTFHASDVSMDDAEVVVESPE